MKKGTLESIKTVLDYFDKHVSQARIFFISISVSIILICAILGVSAGYALYDTIVIYGCKVYGK
jgi:hypothetical protein